MANIWKEPKPQGEEWQKYRMAVKTIGGSDASIIAGCSKFKSAYSLWAEKTGKVIPEDISDKEAVRLGNDLEHYVAERFTEATGKKVRNDNFVWHNDDYPFAHANLDRLVVGEKAGLECKTTSSFDVLAQCRDGNYPAAWYCQMQHYMMITGYSKWYLGVLIFGSGFYWFEVERNENDIAALAELERDFHSKCLAGEPPAADGSEATAETLRTIFAEGKDGLTVDLSPFRTELATLEALEKQSKEIDEQITGIKNSIMAYMGEADNGSCDSYSITWKNTSRRTFDKKAFEKANGVIPDDFYKTSVSRTFKFNVKKGNK